MRTRSYGPRRNSQASRPDFVRDSAPLLIPWSVTKAIAIDMHLAAAFVHSGEVTGDDLTSMRAFILARWGVS